MATLAQISAQIRELKVSPASLRRGDRVPAIVYGKGQTTTPLVLETQLLDRLLRQFGTSHLVELSINEGQPVRVFIQALQRDPITDRVIHVDFHQVAATEKMKVKVPLKCEGVAPAVKELGGTLVQVMSEVHVECLPEDLPEAIIVPIAKLAVFGDSINIGGLAIPPGVKVLDKPEATVVKVVEVKEEKIEAAPAAGPVPEPEVVGKKGVAKEEAEAGEEPKTKEKA